ncbi:MAG: hypothetical protein HN341_01785 [Verrucomicrobia bacterium]|jgi:hypothetical protein|nr:hypothetical protein [Verrucomicrobiota bacterium]
MVIKWVVLIVGFLFAVAVAAVLAEASEYEHHELSGRRFREMVLWVLFVLGIVVLLVWTFYSPSTAP